MRGCYGSSEDASPRSADVNAPVAFRAAEPTIQAKYQRERPLFSLVSTKAARLQPLRVSDAPIANDPKSWM